MSQRRRTAVAATALALGVGAAIVFAGLVGRNLEAQGPQYDELHQAAGAFTWLGAPPPPVFCLDFHGICVLNTTYSAAIKTNLYGLVLFLSGRGFDLGDWRWLGILIAAGGLLLVAWLAREAMTTATLAIFLALVISDGTVLLLVRHDWGPICLALVLRLAILAVWLRGEQAPAGGAGNTFLLAALTGLAAFEKLSSCVLAPALAVMLWTSEHRRSRRHLLAFGAGLAAGLLPLGLVNLGWFARTGELLSWREVSGARIVSPLAFLGDQLALGHGGKARQLILGLQTSKAQEILEMALLAAALALAAFVAYVGRRESELRRAGAALLGYAAVGAGLWLLPRATWIHHWISSTPFQYMAIALAVQGLLGSGRQRARRAAGAALLCLIATWLTARTVALVALERSLARGDAAEGWDPGLARLGEFASRHAGEALFVASGWGVGTQIQCYGNGQRNLVAEPFWDYGGARQLHDLLAASGKRTVYLVGLRRAPIDSGLAARIERDLAADPDWQAVPVEQEAATWSSVALRKFVVRPRSASRAAVQLPGAPTGR